MGFLGYKHSEETKKKLSEIKTGNKNPMWGITRTEETRKKQIKTRLKNGKSSGMKGKYQSEEAKRKIREALKGIPKTPEHNEKNSQSQTGEKNHRYGKKLTEEQKEKISTKLKNRKFTDEHKKKISDSMVGKYSGENSPTWKGGISFEPYCPKFNRSFKKRVRDFFGNKCVLCGKTEEENNKKLCVHHVNYDKRVCCNDNEKLFVILCNSCHSKTNSEREYWDLLFRELIFERYNGQCYLSSDTL